MLDPRNRSFMLHRCRLLAFFLVLPFLVLPLLSAGLYGQTDTARIQGTVTDITGAVIPSATITVDNTDQGTTSTAVSDASGNFTVSGLTRGNYTLKADATGFETLKRTFSLDVSQVRVLDLALSPV